VHTGTIRAGTVASAYAIRLLGAGPLLIVGDVYGGLGNYTVAFASLLNAALADTVEIRGNIYGGDGLLAYGATLAYARQYLVIGNLYGGVGRAAYGAQILLTYPYLTLVSGNVYASPTSPGIMFNSDNACTSPTVLSIIGDVDAADNGAAYPDCIGSAGIATSTHFRVITRVSGGLHDSPLGFPAVSGLVFRDVAHPQPYIDLPYIDPATDEITTERLWRRPGRILPIRGGLG